MRLVTFGRAMAPHGVGDTRLVTDDVAEKLGKVGVLSGSDPWPAASDAPAAQRPRRASPTPKRPGAPDLSKDT